MKIQIKFEISCTLKKFSFRSNVSISTRVVLLLLLAQFYTWMGIFITNCINLWHCCMLLIGRTSIKHELKLRINWEKTSKFVLASNTWWFFIAGGQHKKYISSCLTWNQYFKDIAHFGKTPSITLNRLIANLQK